MRGASSIVFAKEVETRKRDAPYHLKKNGIYELRQQGIDLLEINPNSISKDNCMRGRCSVDSNAVETLVDTNTDAEKVSVEKSVRLSGRK